MRCEEFESRLNDLLDERRHPNFDALVSRHARLCPRCRDVLTVYGIVLDELRFLEIPTAPEDLPARVRDQLRSPFSLRLRRYGVSLAWVAAAAVVAGILLFRGGDKATNSPLLAKARQVPSRAPPAQIAPASPAMGLLARQATTHYASLARDTTGALSQVMWLLPGARVEESPEVAAQATAADRPTGRVAEVAAGFKPLADSTAGAVNFLLNVLPMGPAAQEPAGSFAPGEGETSTTTI